MKQKNNPDLEDVIDGAIEDALYSTNCHRIGKIEAFNADNQTATISLVDKGVKFFSDTEQLIALPPLEDCPVIVNKGLNGGLTIPITVGDTCLVLFNDRDMDNWLDDGLTQRPNTLRKHDFSDAIALVGIRNEINKIADFNNGAVELNYLTTKISIDDKLTLENAAESLKAILDEFITIITNLKTVDPVSGDLPIDGATASSLSSLSTRINSLLK